MKCVFILIGFALISSTVGFPQHETQAIILRQKRENDMFSNTKHLIEELVGNLRLSAKQALNAMGNFSIGINEQLGLFRKDVEKNVEVLRERIQRVITDITDRIQDASSTVKECAEIQRQNASSLLNETLYKTTRCADGQIDRIGGLIKELTDLSDGAVIAGNEALLQMNNCTEQHQGHFFAMGACLGSIVIQSEVKAAIFGGQSGILLARINLAIATLPSALEVCAGARLVEAGARTAHLIMQIGQCSVSSAYSTLTGN